jgi:hypothetical protein
MSKNGKKMWVVKKKEKEVVLPAQKAKMEVQPKKGRGFRRKKEVLADRMLAAAGGQGVDSRSPSANAPKVGVSSQLMKGVTSTIKVAPFVRSEAIWMLAYGPVVLAIQRGWLANADSFPQAAQLAYDAWIYLIKAFYNSMQGTFPALQSAPKWYWEINAGLLPTNAPFKTGSIQYSWECPYQIPTPTTPYSSNASIMFGYPSGGIIDGFTVLTPVSAYDNDAGAIAIASLFGYMVSQGMAEMTAKPGYMILEQDTSAFTSTYVEWGTSITTTGGMALTLQNEKFIDCPIMAKFAQYQQADGRWRGFQEMHKGAGTSCYIIPRVLEFKNQNGFRNKASPIFKFYNFDEYFLTLSYILAQASERLSNDNSTKVVPVCTLTSQQVQIVLRQAILPRFFNVYAQDLLNEGVTGATLTPFSVCINGSSEQLIQAMKLPFVFTENIRSATRRTVKTSRSGGYQVDVLPILSRPDVPQLKNFTWRDSTGVDQVLYADPGSEVPINLIDLSVTDNGTSYLSITGKPLSALTSTWNDYITSLGSCLSSLCTIGDEGGISALLSTFNTRHIQFSVNLAVAPLPAVPVAGGGMVKKNSKLNVRGNDIPERKKIGKPAPGPGSETYQNWIATRLTSTDPFYASLWRYESSFVQPSSYGGAFATADNTVSFQQTFQIEPFSMPYSDLAFTLSSNGQAVDIDVIAFASATLDIKTQLASESEAELELKELAEQGRGGFFTSLAGAIGEGLGIPGAREVAQAIGAVTGL